MKAWRLNEFDWYAADTLEEAIEVAMKETGLERDGVYDEMCGGYAESDNALVHIGDGFPPVTVKDYLETMKAPGLAFSTES